MESERWQQVDKILEAALEQEESERSAFLEKACAGDESLRKEVESLLLAHNRAGDFMEEPPLEVGVAGLAKAQSQSLIGSQLHSYKILSLLGVGGMGEVFLAQDTTLDRKAALKFLPEELQQDSIARKRFLREAKSAAALDHPFICHIHEVGEVEGKSFISMEYVQGETLKDKLAAGPLPLKDALEKATEVAEALEEAHKQGIVHRDLKPSNIMLTPQGHVKVMDFGLAKRVTPVEGQEQEITTALTKQGATLGTVPYMSPEQVRGQEVDTRSDIFSFGVVLYEMLTGVNPFKAGSAMDTAHAILGETPPPLTRYTENIPVLLQHTVRKMLAKEADRRYQLIHDVRTNLGELIEESGDSIREVAARPSGASSAAGGWRRAIPWSVAAVAVIVAGVAIWILMRSTLQPSLKKLEITPPATAPLANFGSNELVISPDGTRIVYQAATAGRTQLYVRSLDELIATPIAGTEGALGNPFFSPDGESVAFFTTDNKLKKISLMGGTPITLCDTFRAGLTGSWAEDTIVFSQGPGLGALWELYQVSANGGEPESLAVPDAEKRERQYSSPEILPGGKTVLFDIWLGGTSLQTAVLSLETGERKVLLEGGRQAHYAPTGHLVYELPGTGTLVAVPFDLGRLEIAGDSVPILQGVRQTPNGWVDYSFSGDGTLVYAPGGSGAGLSRLVWVDRQGAVEPLGTPPHVYRGPRLSPDGRRLAVQIQGPGDIWVYDIARETLTRLTFEGDNSQPHWTPDGKRVTWRSIRDGVPGNLFWKLADGTGAVERLTTSEFRQNPGSWSPDGQVLAFHQQPSVGSSATNRDIWILPLEGERKPQSILQTQFNELAPVFSPDGRWLAYVSDESGRNEIYVRPFPEVEKGKWQISTDGGTELRWAANGELFYRNESGDQMMAVNITTEPTFGAGTPRLLFEGVYTRSQGGSAFYDVTPDGQRFVMVQVQETGSTQIHVVLNWFEELKRLVPTN